jgi:thioester reductase-like protein
MKYLLLTGSTGLLGRYLLRDFLTADRPVAVVVRSSKAATSAERIEAIMAHWEGLIGRLLPRPVVLDGDINQPGLGLDSAASRWVAENCDTVLHSAASMTFKEDKRGEPFRTNIEGTRNFVTFCRDAGLRKFHHVSTAYLCGLRTGRVLETELDLGQDLGNVYEKSKLEAEKLIRAAEHFDERTFYRPASIVGDSQTGYVTSYHGFYLPLQLAYTMASRIPPDQMTDRFITKLGLAGHEGKNFVPVDWVAGAISYLVMHPEHHQNTYHIAAPGTVDARLFQRVVQDAIRQFWSRPIPRQATPDELAAYEKLFQEHMSIYQSHWRDDPQFDLTNTSRALPHLPCPEMDYDLLMRVAKYPVVNNFGLKKFEHLKVPFTASTHLARWAGAASDMAAGQAAVNLQITGPGGGPWRLGVVDGKVVAAAMGLASAPQDSIRLSSGTLEALLSGKLTVQQAVHSGKTVLQAGRRTADELREILSQVVSA